MKKNRLKLFEEFIRLNESITFKDYIFSINDNDEVYIENPETNEYITFSTEDNTIKEIIKAINKTEKDIKTNKEGWTIIQSKSGDIKIWNNKDDDNYMLQNIGEGDENHGIIIINSRDSKQFIKTLNKL